MTQLSKNTALSHRPSSLNAQRHGLTSHALPPGCAYVERKLARFRQQVENAALAAKGQINLVDAASIQTAVQWQKHSELAARWLRVSFDDLSPTDRLLFSRESARALSERDKALDRLQLDRQQVDPWSAIDVTPQRATDIQSVVKGMEHTRNKGDTSITDAVTTQSPPGQASLADTPHTHAESGTLQI